MATKREERAWISMHKDLKNQIKHMVFQRQMETGKRATYEDIIQDALKALKVCEACSEYKT